MSGRRFPRIPTTTHLHVVDDAADRLVVHIPGGGPQSAGLGCFAILWNGILLCITAAMVFAGFQENDETPLWFIGALLLLFWAIGLGMAWFWARMRFTRYNLLVEPDRVVIQKSFGRRKSIEETAMDSDSAVDLLERYRQNDVPVHVICVRGADRTLKFGTALSEQDKRYLAHKIRLVTRLEEPTEDERAGLVREFPTHCASCGAPLPPPERGALTVVCAHCGSAHGASAVSPAPTREDSLPFEDLAPSDLPPDSVIQADDSRPDRLELRYPAFAPKSRWGVAGCAAVAGLFLTALLLGAFNVVVGFFGGPPGLHLAGSLLLGIGLPVLFIVACLRSSCHVVLDRERLEGTWKLGPLKFRREVPVGEIRQVVLTQNPDDGSASGSRRGVRGSYSEAVTCVVASDTIRIPLTSNHEFPTARQLAGIIRGRLRELGCEVS